MYTDADSETVVGFIAYLGYKPTYSNLVVSCYLCVLVLQGVYWWDVKPYSTYRMYAMYAVRENNNRLLLEL